MNKEKIQDLIDKQRINLAEVEYLDLDDVTKVVENFENPTISDEKVSFRRDKIRPAGTVAQAFYEEATKP